MITQIEFESVVCFRLSFSPCCAALDRASPSRLSHCCKSYWYLPAASNQALQSAAHLNHHQRAYGMLLLGYCTFGWANHKRCPAPNTCGMKLTYSRPVVLSWYAHMRFVPCVLCRGEAADAWASVPLHKGRSSVSVLRAALTGNTSAATKRSIPSAAAATGSCSSPSTNVCTAALSCCHSRRTATLPPQL